jgi:hypothetical protein
MNKKPQRAFGVFRERVEQFGITDPNQKRRLIAQPLANEAEEE